MKHERLAAGALTCGASSFCSATGDASWKNLRRNELMRPVTEPNAVKPFRDPEDVERAVNRGVSWYLENLEYLNYMRGIENT